MAAKRKVAKGVDTASFGITAASGNAISVQTIKAIDKSLTPQEAYQLCIDVQSAIKAIVTNCVKAKLRLFSRRSGDEIIAGDLYNLLRRPAPSWSTSAFLTELITWYELAGEMVASVLPGGAGGVAGVLPLNPFRLSIQDPVLPNDKSEIKKWRYFYPNGITVMLDPMAVMHEKNFNPFSTVRGISPLLAAVNQISAAYQATAYNRRFFVNDCIPSHILVLPEGTTPQDKEAFMKEYVANHSTFGGNNGKVWAINGGKGWDVKTLETPPKEGGFLKLQQMTTSQVMQLYKVPPVHGGQWDQTKFDSVDVQNEVFAESKLLPTMELISCFLQTQLVDRFYNVTTYGKAAGKPHIGKAFAPIFERAREERVESDIIVLLDPDTLPIISEIKRSRLGYAKELQATFKVTPAQAAEECGFEFPETEANTLVWVLSTERPVDPDKPLDDPAGADGANVGGDAPDAPGSEPDAPATDPQADDTEPSDDTDAAEKAVRYKDFYRALRKLALDCIDAGRMFKLSEADNLIKQYAGEDRALVNEVRKDFIAIYTLVKANVDKDVQKRLVKDTLNRKNKQYLRALARTAV